MAMRGISGVEGGNLRCAKSASLISKYKAQPQKPITIFFYQTLAESSSNLPSSSLNPKPTKTTNFPKTPSHPQCFPPLSQMGSPQNPTFLKKPVSPNSKSAPESAKSENESTPSKPPKKSPKQ
jgi:hypothetical protein